MAVAVMVMTVGGANAASLTNNGQTVMNVFPIASNQTDLANTLAGEPYADVMGTSISIQREFRKALPSIYSNSQTEHYQERADMGISGEGYASVAAVTSHVVRPGTACAPGKKWVMWDVPFYMNEKQKPTDGALGYSNIASGFATGLSRMIGESSAIGLAIGYDARRLTPKGGYHFRNTADTLHMALYGGTNVGNFLIDAYAGWSRSWNRMEREVIDGSARGINKANYKDNVFSAGLKASCVWIFRNDVRVTPSFGLDFSHVRVDAINERHHSGANAVSALRGDKSNYSNLAMPLKVSVSKTFGSNFMAFRGVQSLWTPEVRAGYVPVVGKKRADIDFRDTGVPTISWNTTSAKFAGSYGTVGSSLKVKLADKCIFEVAYDYTFGKKYSVHSVTGMYGVSF